MEPFTELQPTSKLRQSPELQTVDPPLPIDPPLRLEAWAEMERFFAEGDRRVALFLSPRGSRRLNTVYYARLRERNLVFWDHQLDRAKAEGPHPETNRQQAAREYLAGYVRPSVRHSSLMERACPTWLICSVMGFAALWFFVPAVFPHQAETLTDFLKGLFL